jgi:hypothetical protein
MLDTKLQLINHKAVSAYLAVSSIMIKIGDILIYSNKTLEHHFNSTFVLLTHF